MAFRGAKWVKIYKTTYWQLLMWGKALVTW